MKKILALVAVGLVFGLGLSGCGGGDDSTAPSGDAAATGAGGDLSAVALAPEQESAINKWMAEFQPSTLSPDEMRAELEWFAKTAAQFKGLEITSVAEGIKTHSWESEVLAKAFTEITGIKVTHDIIGEGEIVDRVQRQIQTNRKLYDIYVNDTDLVGTHLRLNSALNLSEYMAGEGAPYTNPMLDLDDFLNLEFGQDYEGNQLQLPDQQFANLYWFRYDWFNREDLKQEFKDKYGYELGVPLNWAAYEDIAEFFTGREIDGQTVYGHMDYGKKSPSLGWRFTDAWLSIAGVGDPGLPNGLPVDEWGIRAEDGIPVGASVSRVGAANGPAAVYALTKYVDWMKAYAPPFAASMTWSEAGTVPARGIIAQRVFQYTTWLSEDEYTAPGSPVVGEDGKPLWRVAPTPHGKYWEEGMKVGYQDCGSWTILQKSVTGDSRHAAWLWAQFCVSKSVSLKKFLVGKTPVRKSTVHAKYLEDQGDDFGGNLRSSPSPRVSHLGYLGCESWQILAPAVTGEVTPQQAMDNIAKSMDDIMGKLNLEKFSPKLNEERDPQYWLDQPGAPKAERPEEEPATMAYEELIKMWE